jgi:hypothetical protein
LPLSNENPLLLLVTTAWEFFVPVNYQIHAVGHKRGSSLPARAIILGWGFPKKCSILPAQLIGPVLCHFPAHNAIFRIPPRHSQFFSSKCGIVKRPFTHFIKTRTRPCWLRHRPNAERWIVKIS